MENNTAREIYNEWHQNLEPLDDPADSPWHQMAKQYLPNLKHQKVLEIGCGRGGFSAYLVEQGANLVAADFSDAAVAITRKRLQPYAHCEARVADIQALPFADRTFDVVVSLETLEHVPDPAKGLAELVRVTKVGGQLIISTPNYFGLLGLYRFYREVTGRGFSEVGQPINHPLKVRDRVQQLQALQCRVDVVDGCGHYLYIPRTYGIRMTWLDRPKALTKWFAAHSLTVATKL